MARKLTGKQQVFIQRYLVHNNATQAAIEAGYSQKTAAEIACENLGKPQIIAAIEAERAKQRQAMKVTRESMSRQFDEDRAAAERLDNPSAMVAASTAKAKLHGLFVEKRDISLRRISQMTEEELLEFLNESEGEGISGPPAGNA